MGATIPLSVTIASGKTSGTFSIKTLPVASATKATVSANLNGTTQTGSFTVLPPVLVSLTLSPITVAGGKTSTGTLKISAAAPTGGLTVTVSSSSSSASVPTTVTIAAGKTSATFTVKTVKVTSKTTVTISASAGGASKTATLTVT